jgi:hypothetical protein
MCEYVLVQGGIQLTREFTFEAQHPIPGFALQGHQLTPNNSLQRTHQSVTLFASQKPRLFAVPLSSGR